jgi:hypothetical protein
MLLSVKKCGAGGTRTGVWRHFHRRGATGWDWHDDRNARLTRKWRLDYGFVMIVIEFLIVKTHNEKKPRS